MSTPTIRVSRSTHELLKALAIDLDTTITSVVDQAARELQRRRFWEEFNASCQSMADDAWAGLRHEDAAWESTLADGLQEQSLEQRSQPDPGRSLDG